MSRLFFVSGESSGDIHGANLIRALRTLDPDLECEGLGGWRMAGAGMHLHHDLASSALMGFTEVIRSAGYISRVYRDTVKLLEESPPDALVLIDYPGFNIRIARRAHALGIPVVYYISPQVWAWKKDRIHTLARVVTKMLVILPFEKALYDDVHLDCVYVGHPMVDHIAEQEIEGHYEGDAIVALMPGSRDHEIRRHFRIMLDVARELCKQHPEIRLLVPCVNRERAAQLSVLAQGEPVEIIIDDTYEILNAARFALVASGTATLETALLNVPMVVMYKVSALTYRLARWLTDLEFIAIINILSEREIVPEFIQHEATVETILPIARDLFNDTERRATMLEDFRLLREALGSGNASMAAAKAVHAVLLEKSNG